MADAFDTRELVAALDEDHTPLTINDLPKELSLSLGCSASPSPS